jgi:hypothetical protein
MFLQCSSQCMSIPFFFLEVLLYVSNTSKISVIFYVVQCLKSDLEINVDTVST